MSYIGVGSDLDARLLYHGMRITADMPVLGWWNGVKISFEALKLWGCILYYHPEPLLACILFVWRVVKAYL